MRKKIHIVLLGFYERDAIGNFTRAIATRLEMEGHQCAIYAQDHSPSLHIAGTYDDFFGEVCPEDVLLYMLSTDEAQLSRLMEVPCRRVVYYHNITPGHFFQPYDAGIADMLNRGRKSLHIVSRAHAVFANSAWSLEELRPHIAAGARYGVMPPLTEAMFDQHATLQWSKITPEWLPVPYLLTMGRLVPHKNILWGLRFFAALHRLMPDLHYAIIGGEGGIDGYADEVRDYATSLGDAASRVIFVGETDEREKACWLQNSTGLLCSSLHEGFGVPLVEAMACGVMVIALAQPAVCETLGNGGLLLQGDDIAEDSAAVAALLRDASARKLIRQHQLERFAALRAESTNNVFWQVISPE